ncbi:MAG: tetraacyldisaccharide 4'-kinase [Candidatus Omnitrophica bacterium]|nr:tetraacyldisaccharide 4'-kinase [Candidatus Omnitrophota bacterium]
MKEFLKRVITDKDKSMAGSALKPFLWLLSWLYTGAVVLKRWLYHVGVMKVHKAGCPVISIGNITAGGVGKTPLVIFMAEFLRKRGLKPVILTRGYMGRAPMAESDEAKMLAERLGGVTVMVDPDRVRATIKAEQRSPVDVFVLDDGFQHWRLKRDLDLVAIDATDPFGNGRLLPRGLLREPLSALKRADLFILTKTDIGHQHVPRLRSVLHKINPRCGIVETVHAPVAIVNILTGERSAELSLLKDRMAAMCAIGSPDSFAGTLKAQGAQVERLFAFDDHYVYDAGDVTDIVRFCVERKISKVVTTHKDAVKIRAFSSMFSGVSFLVLEIDIKVTYGENELFSRIDRLLHP